LFASLVGQRSCASPVLERRPRHLHKWDLQPIIDEIGDRAFLLHGGSFSDELPFMARYEIDHDADTKTPEILILAFCLLIERLSPATRALWDSSRQKVVDLGYDVLISRDRTHDRITADTLARRAVL
jgi:hypothetical protein